MEEAAKTLRYWKTFFERDGMGRFQRIKEENPTYAAECLEMLIRDLANAADLLQQGKPVETDHGQDGAQKRA